MAKGKKGVLVYADWIDKFEECTDEEAGKLIKHFFRFINDLNPEPPDRTTKLLFLDIQASLKRDLNKWEETKEKRSLAGKESARIRAEQKSTNSTSVDFCQQASTKSTDNVSVNVNDNVNVSTIVDDKPMPLDYHEMFKKQCLEEQAWIESVCMTTRKVRPDNIHKGLEAYNKHLIAHGEKKTNRKDYKSHFVNWLNKRPEGGSGQPRQPNVVL